MGKRKRYRLRRVMRRIHLRIRNSVDEFHKKCALWLCTSYKCILLPSFDVSTMVQRGKRKINSKTARSMLTWGHYRFRQRLIGKSLFFPQTKVIVTEEPYTSKTCGACGFVNYELGSKKVFRCPECKVELDRDVNGARNVLLRYLTLHCSGEQ